MEVAAEGAAGGESEKLDREHEMGLVEWAKASDDEVARGVRQCNTPVVLAREPHEQSEERGRLTAVRAPAVVRDCADVPLAREARLRR